MNRGVGVDEPRCVQRERCLKREVIMPWEMIAKRRRHRGTLTDAL
jgi:hypothetical protein